MRSVAVLGDAADPAAWSGTPYHFWQAGVTAEFVSDAIRLQLSELKWPRRFWAVRRLASMRRPEGFQYSNDCLDWAEAQIPDKLLAGEVISFNQHFPRACAVRRAGGRITYYIDATFAALSSGRGLDLRLPRDVVARARELECENYALADRVVTMARWAADSAINDCGVAPEKVFTVLPGANLELPEDWAPPDRPIGRPGRDRPFVLGFVGKDWQRKGLPLVCAVRDVLASQGWNVVVRAIGEAPPELSRRTGVEFCGFINKRRDAARFVSALASCDVGCLFSDREALGISTLEFLRVGVPAAGFVVEGLADALPPDAGFRFALGTTPERIAEEVSAALDEPGVFQRLSQNARAWSAELTWVRCVKELQQIWGGAPVDRPVRPWLGLAALTNRCAQVQ